MTEQTKTDGKTKCSLFPNNADPQTFLKILKDSRTLTKVNHILTQKGIPTSCSSLRLEANPVSDQQIVELDAEDIQKLFSNFGAIDNVIASKSSAIITFKDVVSAYFAQQTLHLHVIPAYQVQLSVKWYIAEESCIGILNTNPHIGAFLSSAQMSEAEVTTSQEQSVSSVSTRGNNNTLLTSKFTCRFEIQIENDKEFQVARRLIGTKGRNMKKILDMCCLKGSHIPVQDIIKLRLRGRGSGFKEGPNQEESDEPLHLCVSSPYQDKYVLGCNLVKELINGVYAEYKIFSKRNGKKKIPDLQIKMIENVARIEDEYVPKHNGTTKAGYFPGKGTVPQYYYPYYAPRTYRQDIPYPQFCPEKPTPTYVQQQSHC